MDWHALRHAYGAADNVPRTIQDLTSSDDEVREDALAQLGSSLCHQGTLYSATAPAIPLLFAVAKELTSPGRRAACEILGAIAEAANVDPARIRQTWAWRKEKIGEIYARPTDEMADAEVASVVATRAALIDGVADLEALAKDADETVATRASEMLGQLLAR